MKQSKPADGGLVGRFCNLTLAWTLCAGIPSTAWAGMARVDFKYVSLTHLGFAKSVVSTPNAVRPTVDLAADFLRSNGATIAGITQSNVQFTQTVDDRLCEEWTNSITQQEMTAFARNKFNEYKAINRKFVPAACTPKPSWIQYGYTATADNDVDGYRIDATIDRSVNYTSNYVRPMFSTLFGGPVVRNSLSMVPGSVTNTVNFVTHLSLWVWRAKGDTRTHVFGVAVPESGGVMAAPGAGISIQFLAVADGRHEAALVQNVLSIIVQKGLLTPPAPPALKPIPMPDLHF